MNLTSDSVPVNLIEPSSMCELVLSSAHNGNREETNQLDSESAIIDINNAAADEQ